MKDTYAFPVVFDHSNKDMTFLLVPDLGSFSIEPNDTALEGAKKLIANTIMDMEEENEPIPEPSKVEAFPPTDYNEIKMVEVDMSKYRKPRAAVHFTVQVPRKNSNGDNSTDED